MTYHALDERGEPLAVSHLTLNAALDLAEQHLASGLTPLALEIAGQRLDLRAILLLLDERAAARATKRPVVLWDDAAEG